MDDTKGRHILVAFVTQLSEDQQPECANKTLTTPAGIYDMFIRAGCENDDDDVVKWSEQTEQANELHDGVIVAVAGITATRDENPCKHAQRTLIKMPKAPFVLTFGGKFSNRLAHASTMLSFALSHLIKQTGG